MIGETHYNDLFGIKCVKCGKLVDGPHVDMAADQSYHEGPSRCLSWPTVTRPASHFVFCISTISLVVSVLIFACMVQAALFAQFVGRAL